MNQKPLRTTRSNHPRRPLHPQSAYADLKMGKFYGAADYSRFPPATTAAPVAPLWLRTHPNVFWTIMVVLTACLVAGLACYYEKFVREPEGDKGNPEGEGVTLRIGDTGDGL